MCAHRRVEGKLDGNGGSCPEQLQKDKSPDEVWRLGVVGAGGDFSLRRLGGDGEVEGLSYQQQ